MINASMMMGRSSDETARVSSSAQRRTSLSEMLQLRQRPSLKMRDLDLEPRANEERGDRRDGALIVGATVGAAERNTTAATRASRTATGAA